MVICWGKTTRMRSIPRQALYLQFRWLAWPLVKQGISALIRAWNMVRRRRRKWVEEGYELGYLGTERVGVVRGWIAYMELQRSTWLLL